jgi:hypothetical protein
MYQKHLHANVPRTFRTKLSNSDRYELRSNKNKLMLSKPKTNSMKRIHAAAKVWNERNKNS